MSEETRITATKLRHIMSYYYGTEKYYENELLEYRYTDGVKAFCENAEAYWFLDLVESVRKAFPQIFEENFIAVSLNVSDKKTAEITFENNKTVFYSEQIPFTDCPRGQWNFFYDSGVLLWNGEY